MIFRPKDVYINGKSSFLPSPKTSESSLPTSPAVLRGKEIIQSSIASGNFRDLEEFIEMAGRLTDPQPCSLDITLERFKHKNGKPLSYPVEILPGQEVVGYSDFSIRIPQSLICVETRSAFARKGLACLGFYLDGQTEIFGAGRVPMSFVLKNYSPNTLLIPHKFSPVQVSVTIEKELADLGHAPVRLFREGEDVTKESRVLGNLGEVLAYRTNLSDEMAYFRELNNPVDILGDESKSPIVITTVNDIHKIKPSFCLTKTEESVHTGGHPVYMFPFHYLDAVDNPSCLMGTPFLSGFVRRVVNGEFLMVTGNAGLINPKADGIVVCENIIQGKGTDLQKYFQPHKPFALVVPVPFHDGGLDTKSYNGNHNGQEKITF